MLQSCQETIEKLGNQLGERREWRKQLASELELLREDLKAEKVLSSQMCTSYRFALHSQEECCEHSSLGSGQCSSRGSCMQFLQWDPLQGRDAFLAP